MIGILAVCLFGALYVYVSRKNKREAAEEQRQMTIEEKGEVRREFGQKYKDAVTQVFVSEYSESTLSVCANDHVILYNKLGYKVEDILGLSLINAVETEKTGDGLGTSIAKGVGTLLVTGNEALAAAAGIGSSSGVIIKDNFGLRIVLKGDDKDEDIVFACGDDKNTPVEAYKAIRQLMDDADMAADTPAAAIPADTRFDAAEAEQCYKDYRDTLEAEEPFMTRYRNWAPLLKPLSLLSLDEGWMLEDMRTDRTSDNTSLRLCAVANKYGKPAEDDRYVPSEPYGYYKGAFEELALVDEVLFRIRLGFNTASIWQAWLLFRTDRFVGMRGKCVSKELTFVFPSAENNVPAPNVHLIGDDAFIITHGQKTASGEVQIVTATGRYNPKSHRVTFEDIREESVGGVRKKKTEGKNSISSARYDGRMRGMLMCLDEQGDIDIQEGADGCPSEKLPLVDICQNYPEEYEYIKQLLDLKKAKEEETMTQEEREHDYMAGIEEAKKVYLDGMKWSRLLKDKDI